MEFMTSDTFVMVITVVGAAAGLFWALRADLGRRIDKVEEGLGKRIDKVEHGLGQRIDKVKEGLIRRIDKLEQGLGQRIDKLGQDLGQRIDRQGDRAHADQKNLATEISELKTAVSVLNAKLDERSSQQRIHLAKTLGSDPEAPEDDPQHPTVSTGEDATVSAAADEDDDAQ